MFPKRCAGLTEEAYFSSIMLDPSKYDYRSYLACKSNSIAV